MPSAKTLAPVLPVIRHHHERMDGSGYPDGLRGDEIPLLARILAVADVFDALTSTRPYKQARTPAQALAIVQDEARCGWRDLEVVEVFTDCSAPSKVSLPSGPGTLAPTPPRSAARSMGFPATGKAARSAETVLQGAVTSKRALTAAEIVLLKAKLEALRQAAAGELRDYSNRQ